MYFLAAAILALFAFVAPAHAQSFDDPEKAAERFCEIFVGQGADQAVNAVKGGSYLGRHRPGPFELWREGLNKTEQVQRARVLGCEPLSDKQLGKVIREARAIIKYDVGPALLTMRFYKPGNTWQLNSFGWVTELEKFPLD